MAVFNPQIQPTQDPNYLGYARVVEAPSPNQSSAIAINTSANLLESGAHAVDTSIKKGIEDEATKRIDPEREKMTAALEQAKKDTAVTPAPALTVSGTTTGSLLDANASMDAPDVPDGVEQGLDRIGQLSDARKATKINDTQYSGNVLAIAKQLRAQYPGYREYVDDQVSKISGLPVANAYYKNLMEDINRQLVQSQGQGNKVESLYLKNLRVPGIQQAWEEYKTGQRTESSFVGKIADYQNLESGYEIGARKRAEEKDNRDVAITNETQRFTKLAANEVNMGLQDITAAAGQQSAGALIKYIQDVAVGNIKATDQELVQRKTQLAAIVQAQSNKLWVRANTPGPDGSTTASVIGSEATKKLISDTMVPMTSFMDFANNKDSSPAFLSANMNQAILDNDVNKFLINKDTGPAARQFRVVRSTLGDTYFPDYIRSMETNGLGSPFKDVFREESLGAIAPITDVRGTPIPRFMKDAIVHGKKIPEAEGSGYVGSVVGLVSNLADPKMPLAAKDAMIRWAYDPKNIGRLDELKMDYRDPNTGEMVPGKYRAFNILSAPAITASVAETAKAHPENYVKYQGTLEREFASLFRTDVAKLSQITDKPYLNAHFSWNDKTNELGLVDNNNRPITRNYRALGIEQPNAVYLNGALDVVDRVNGGLQNLANVQKMNPSGAGDTTQYVFQALKDSNFRPGREITGATDAMKAMFKSRNPEATNEDIDKLLLKSSPRSNFAPEEDRSLGAFLRNPTGTVSTDTGLEPQQTRGVVKGNLSDGKLLDIQVDNIPEGMSARDYIRQLQSTPMGKRTSGDAQDTAVGDPYRSSREVYQKSWRGK